MNGYNILVIEDDNSIQRLLTDFLEGEGYIVGQAYSGTEALLLFKQKTWDLVLLDLMLPGRNGQEVLTELRKTSAVPVIILTAREDTASKIDALKSGADDFISKPFDLEELAARIESNLRRTYKYSTPSSNQKPGILTFKDITLDADSRIAKVSGQELLLTGTEFSILEIMMKFPEKVFSKANLFESIRGEFFLSDENTINVHISNLRNKLSKHSSCEYIQTVWGIGYKLCK